MTNKLGRFGYFELRARRDNLLCAEGETLRAHEFHYSQSGSEGSDFELTKPGGAGFALSVHATETLYAGYPHISFAGENNAAKRFTEACVRYSRSA
jgi:cobyrinic acid a,c-diamide synthase